MHFLAVNGLEMCYEAYPKINEKRNKGKELITWNLTLPLLFLKLYRVPKTRVLSGGECEFKKEAGGNLNLL